MAGFETEDGNGGGGRSPMKIRVRTLIIKISELKFPVSSWLLPQLDQAA